RSKPQCWLAAFFERPRRACKTPGTPWRRSAARPAGRSSGFARRTRPDRSVVRSFARAGRFAHDFVIPAGVVAFGKGDGNVPADDGAKRAALGKNSHVQMNHEKPDGEQRGRRMNEDGKIPQEAQIPGNVFGEP